MFIMALPEDMPLIKEKMKLIGDATSWCMCSPNQVFMQKLLCYFLVARGCPEFLEVATIDMVEQRFFEDEENPVRNLISFAGIVIIRHSSHLIRNKLMLETLLNVVSERFRRGKSTIVISDKSLDVGDYTYYDHKQVKHYIQPDITGASKEVSPVRSLPTSSTPRVVLNRTATTEAKESTKYRSSRFSKSKSEPKECALTGIVPQETVVSSNGNTEAGRRRALMLAKQEEIANRSKEILNRNKEIASKNTGEQ